MSLSLNCNLRDLAKLNRRIDKLANLDTRDLLDSVGQIVVGQTKTRLSDEKQNPDGEAWADLSPKWAAKKSETSSGGTLEFKGNLIISITHDVQFDEVLIGSNLPYAAVHDLGSKDGTTPQRQFLGVSTENEHDIVATLNDWIDGAIL